MKMTVIPLVIGLPEDEWRPFIIKIGQNTEKNLQYLKRLSVKKSHVKDHELTLVGKKTHQRVTIINIRMNNSNPARISKMTHHRP